MNPKKNSAPAHETSRYLESIIIHQTILKIINDSLWHIFISYDKWGICKVHLLFNSNHTRETGP